jgi:hypothetical protein
MKPSDELRRVGKDEPPKLSRSEEARWVIEEYIDQLREIIKNLRRRLH